MFLRTNANREWMGKQGAWQWAHVIWRNNCFYQGSVEYGLPSAGMQKRGWVRGVGEGFCLEWAYRQGNISGRLIRWQCGGQDGSGQTKCKQRAQWQLQRDRESRRGKAHPQSWQEIRCGVKDGGILKMTAVLEFITLKGREFWKGREKFSVWL